MNNPNKHREANAKKTDLNRIRRLPKDLVVTPIEELPENMLKRIFPDGTIPKGRFAVQRGKVRSFPKIVNKDVVDVLRAFGETGATYNDVLTYFVKERNLDRKEFDLNLRKAVSSLVNSSFLVDAADEEVSSAESVTPSFQEGDRWLDYRIKENVHYIVDSEIYKVEHIPTGELRALKIMQERFPNKEMKETIARRLKHEFTVLGNIHHPNIIRVYEHGTHQGRTYGILDWLEGLNIFAHVNQFQDQLDDGARMNLGIQCVEALRAVHEAGYLHGDVNTNNFLVQDGNICLIDFGLTRPIKMKKTEKSKYTEGGVIMFMPPEYVKKESKKTKGFWGSVAGEVYSCGVVLFVIFTQQYPYVWKPYRSEFMKSIVNEPPLSFDECGRQPWPVLEGVLQQALSKLKKNRFTSMTEFLQKLKHISVPTSSH